MAKSHEKQKLVHRHKICVSEKLALEMWLAISLYGNMVCIQFVAENVDQIEKGLNIYFHFAASAC